MSKPAKTWTKSEISDVLRGLGLFPKNVSIDAYPDMTEVRVHDRVNLDYDDLMKISKVFGTTKIDFHYNAGWGGTEVTPGDAPEFTVTIGLGASE